MAGTLEDGFLPLLVGGLVRLVVTTMGAQFILVTTDNADHFVELMKDLDFGVIILYVIYINVNISFINVSVKYSLFSFLVSQAIHKKL